MMSSVQPKLNTPTEIMTDLEKFEQVRRNRLAATCFFFLIGTTTYTLLYHFEDLPVELL